uniref:Hairy enhancer of split 2 n=1 Tax=Platynereis dumerilii TaxID=6359 RepID=S5UGN5_PLADU|nr:hairy enhancer of split 2 [Platynereis dumerilii]
MDLNMDDHYHSTQRLSVSKAELRKVNKPLMEKRRRARINSCLSQLKMLVLQAVKKDGCSYSKLEKADILEMTVQYLKTVQKNQMLAAATVDPSVINRYSAGYTECTNEAIRYLSSMEGVNKQLKSRLLDHLTTGTTDSVDTSPQMSPPYSPEQNSNFPNSPPNMYDAKIFSFEENRLMELQTVLRNHPAQKVVTSPQFADDVTANNMTSPVLFSDITRMTSPVSPNDITTRIMTSPTPQNHITATIVCTPQERGSTPSPTIQNFTITQNNLLPLSGQTVQAQTKNHSISTSPVNSYSGKSTSDLEAPHANNELSSKSDTMWRPW